MKNCLFHHNRFYIVIAKLFENDYLVRNFLNVEMNINEIVLY